MSALKVVIAVVSFLSFLGLLTPQKVGAGNFNQAYVRLDRGQAQTDTGGTVCVEPSDVGTESFVSVTFPTGFIVNANPVNWEVDVVDLPQGSLPWPGISTATSIIGQKVTFPSSDLTVGNLYCFHFSNNGTLKTSAATSYTGGLLDTGVDSRVFVVGVTTNDQIGVTAAVNASSNDFIITLKALQNDQIFNESEVIDYQLSYLSKLNYPIDITIIVKWTLGTLEGFSDPSIDVVSFVPGSATQGNNNSQPIVDLNNHTITWTLDHFQGSGIINFSLKTKKNFRGTYQNHTVDFDVSAHIETVGTITPEQKITRSYINSYYYRKPNPNAGPDLASIFDSITLESLSYKTALLSITTNRNTTAVIKYGTSRTNLNQQITSFTFNNLHKVSLDGLIPNTPYYFTIEVTDEKKQKYRTNILTFKTASDIQKAIINEDNVLITSNNVILRDFTTTSPVKTIILPKEVTFEIKLLVNDSADTKEIKLISRFQDSSVLSKNSQSKQILGASTAQNLVGADIVKVIELEPGNFYGIMSAPAEIGKYEIFGHLTDLQGNISEQKLFNLSVIDPMMVFEQGSKTPIERAQASLLVYNEKSHIYESISSLTHQVKSPLFSGSDGVFSLVLPIGKYRAEVRAIGYKTLVSDFTIGEMRGDGYPSLYLTKEPFSVLSWGSYYWAIVKEIFASIQVSLYDLSASHRYFDLWSISVVGMVTLLALMAMMARLHSSPLALPHHFLYEMQKLFKKLPFINYLSGRVLDTTQKPLSGAMVYLLNSSTHQVISTSKTNKQGLFLFKVDPQNQYEVMITRLGYEVLDHQQIHREEMGREMNFVLIKNESFKRTLIYVAKDLTQALLGLLFELLLITSLLFEFFFVTTFPWFKIAPFITLSILSVIFLLVYLLNNRRRI